MRPKRKLEKTRSSTRINTSFIEDIIIIKFKVGVSSHGT
jgi:hypothetical protein